MPAMFGAQAASWHGVMDLHDRLDRGWTLVGGQMVHMHCVERGYAPPRATTDVDTVIDVRADRDMLRTFTGTSSNWASQPRESLAREFNIDGYAAMPLLMFCCRTAWASGRRHALVRRMAQRSRPPGGPRRCGAASRCP